MKAANSAAPAKAAVVSADGEAPLGFIPADPQDYRLTPDGAVLDANGRIDIEAYDDIFGSWAGEPEPKDHPRPLQPGVRLQEEVPKGMRMWDDVRSGCTDKDGAGWIATKKTSRLGKKEKWFNIRTCGSWRLSFLLARLQLQAWEREDCAAKVEKEVQRMSMDEMLDIADNKGDSEKASKTPKKRATPSKPKTESPPKKARTVQPRPAKAKPQTPLPSLPAKGTEGKLGSVLDRIRAKMAAKEGGAAAEVTAPAAEAKPEVEETAVPQAAQ
jgi:hypothetical protein